MKLLRFQAVERVNSLFVYEFDKVQYNAVDYWRVLDVDSEKDEGDCEDYALTVAWLLAGCSRIKFLTMLFTGKFKICYVTVNGGGHAILQHEGFYVDNWKRAWCLKSDYERDYAKYDWKYQYAYSPFRVIINLIKGKFWKK